MEPVLSTRKQVRYDQEISQMICVRIIRAEDRPAQDRIHKAGIDERLEDRHGERASGMLAAAIVTNAIHRGGADRKDASTGRHAGDRETTERTVREDDHGHE